MTLLTEQLPGTLHGLMGWVVDALMAVAAGFVAWYGTRLCVATWGQSISELSWLPVGLTCAALPIGAVITLPIVIERRLFGDQSKRPLMRYEEQLEEQREHAAGH